MKKTHVISAFAGSGKSFLANSSEDLKFLDLDSSNYPKDDFPNNYLLDIIKYMKTCEYDYILISTHKEIRDALEASRIKYALVFPHAEQRMRFDDIYSKRGNKEEFIDFMYKNFHSFVLDLFNDSYGFQHVIYNDETLYDHLDDINRNFKIYDSLKILKRFIENNQDNMTEYEYDALNNIYKSTSFSGMYEK